MRISRAIAQQLQTIALAAPLQAPGDPIRAVLPRGNDGLAVLVSANY